MTRGGHHARSDPAGALADSAQTDEVEADSEGQVMQWEEVVIDGIAEEVVVGVVTELERCTRGRRLGYGKI